MIFGSKQTFAIEFVFDENAGGAWMFGKVCYWICNEQIGDYELGTSLRDLLLCWESIWGDRGHRANENLIKMDKRKLIPLIATSLYSYPDGDIIATQIAIEEQWARHDITPEIDVFDNWHIFLIESTPVAKCFYGSKIIHEPKECLLEYGEFDRILSLALKSLRNNYERMRTSPSE